MTPPSRAFQRVMERDAGWVKARFPDRCVRCGTFNPALSLIEWSVPVALPLCPVCAQLCWVELWVNRRPALLAVYRRARSAAVFELGDEVGDRAEGSQGNP